MKATFQQKNLRSPTRNKSLVVQRDGPGHVSESTGLFTRDANRLQVGHSHCHLIGRSNQGHRLFQSRVGPTRFERRTIKHNSREIMVGRRGEAPLVPPYGLPSFKTALALAVKHYAPPSACGWPGLPDRAVAWRSRSRLRSTSVPHNTRGSAGASSPAACSRTSGRAGGRPGRG